MAAKIGNFTRRDGFVADPSDLVIAADPSHPLYDHTARHEIEETLVLNIMALGVRQAVTVAKGEDDRFYVVDGRRRVIHAREANRRLKDMGEPPLLVPIAAEKGSEEAQGLVMVSLNEQRKDDTVLTKARKAEQLRSRGVAEDKIRLAFGVDAKTLSHWSTLLDLAAPVQAAVDAGQISAHAALPLAKLPKAQQKEALGALLERGESGGKKISKTATKRAVAAATGEKVKERPSVKQVRAVYEALPTALRYPDLGQVLAWVLGDESAFNAEVFLETCKDNAQMEET